MSFLHVRLSDRNHRVLKERQAEIIKREGRYVALPEVVSELLNHECDHSECRTIKAVES